MTRGQHNIVWNLLRYSKEVNGQHTSFKSNAVAKKESALNAAATPQGRKYGYCFQNVPLKAFGNLSLGRDNTPPMKDLRWFRTELALISLACGPGQCGFHSRNGGTGAVA